MNETSKNKDRLDLENIKAQIKLEKQNFFRKIIEDQIERQHSEVASGFRDENDKFTLVHCKPTNYEAIINDLIRILAQSFLEQEELENEY